MKKQRRLIVKRREGGFLLLQLAFVLAILGMLAVQETRKEYDRLADMKADAIGTGLDVARKAGDAFLTAYADRIRNGLTISYTKSAGNVLDNLKPTAADLTALGLLPQGSQLGRSLIAGGTYRFQIGSAPVGCTISDPSCNLEGTVCIDQPLKERGKIDYARLGRAARKIGAEGAYSTLEAPNKITGLGGAWSQANPFGSTPGIVCARFGYSSSVNSAFVRRDGSLSMTGDFNVGGKSISDTNNVTASGIVKGGEFLTDVKAAGAACSDLGAIGSGNGVVMVCDGSRWQVDDGIRVAAGSACSPEGRTATSTTTGELLVCKNGAYVRLVSLLAKKVLVQNVLVQDGTVVNMPVCDVGGTADFSFDATQVTLDLTTNPPKQTMYWTAIPSGTTWAVKIRLKDNTGAEISGNTVGLTNIMNLECRY